MTKQPNRKHKGKALQKAEDYQLQIPVQNQFTPLTFPPLPYKNAVTNPSSSRSTNDYVINFTEHLLLTSCKPPHPTNIISSIVQKTFGTNHFATNNLRMTQKFYELILVDTHSVSITVTPLTQGRRDTRQDCPGGKSPRPKYIRSVSIHISTPINKINLFKIKPQPQYNTVTLLMTGHHGVLHAQSDHT